MGIRIYLSYFAFIYNLITFWMILKMNQDQSASLGYVLIFQVFWFLALVILAFILITHIKEKKYLFDIILIFFSTPFPLIIYMLFQ